MSHSAQTARLLPTTKRTKRLIKDYGETWEVIRIGPMSCFNGQTGVQLRSLSKDKLSNIEEEYVQLQE